MDDVQGRRRASTARVLDAALVAMILGALSLLAMQAVSRDWFPPEVSISQYGVGRYGWMLSMTLLFMAAASALLLWGAHRLGGARGWPVNLAWTVWVVALVLMAFVPANEWPSPLTLSGKVHQAAAVCGLFAAPIGAVLMVGLGTRPGTREPGGRARVVVIVSAAASWFFLGLLVLTNVEIDITGLGYQGAWSLHQTVAVVLDVVMSFALIFYHRARFGAAQRGPSASPSSSSSSTSSVVSG